MANTTRLEKVGTKPVAVIATQRGLEVTIQEDPAITGWPTSDFFLHHHDNGEMVPLGRRVKAGDAHVYKRGGREFWFPGDIMCWISTAKGTTDFIVDEAGY